MNARDLYKAFKDLPAGEAYEVNTTGDGATDPVTEFDPAAGSPFEAARPAAGIPPRIAAAAAEGALAMISAGIAARGLKVQWSPLTREVVSDTLADIDGQEWLIGIGRWIAAHKGTVRLGILLLSVMADIRAAGMAAAAAKKRRFAAEKIENEQN